METQTESKATRRAVLQSIGMVAASGVAAACAPSAAPAPAPQAQAPASGKPKEAWEQQWDDTIAAAKKEGVLNFVGFPGAGYREGVAAFEQAFPGITIEYASINASQFGPKVAQERNGGVYNYDLITSNYGTFGLTIIPSGAIEPIRSSLFRPDVVDDKVWNGGFELGLIEGKWGYAGFQEMWPAVWINTDQVKEGEVKTFDDLLNPKWKGKLLMGDPRSFGGGFWPGTTLRMRRGDDAMKRLFKDQEPVLGRDVRQLVEFMVKGQYPIGIGAANVSAMREFLAQGLGKNLKHVPMDELDNKNFTSSILYLLNKAPHPNAAKLFLNWVLTKEGSLTWSTLVQTNSRRKDVEPQNAFLVPPANRNLILVDTEEVKKEFAKTMELGKQLLN